MIWLTWRQFRVQASAVAAVLVVAVALLLSVRPTHTDKDAALLYGGLLAMYVLPALIGIFWGVPTVARELEAGTHNVAWNQTVTRARWLAAKLAIPGGAAMVATGLLSLAIGWWASPIDAAADATSDPEPLPRMSPVVFAARGLVPLGYTAFAFVLGVLVGILLRRTVSAMAVTLVVVVAAQVAMPLVVRPHLLPPREEAVTITQGNIQSIHADGSGDLSEGVVKVEPPEGAWVLTNETVDANGVAPDRLPAEIAACAPRSPERGERGPAPDIESVWTCFAKLSDLGYRQHIVYHPLGHFWPLQWLEAALFAALTAVLAWMCFRALRRLS